jgi:ferrochelatase
MNSFDALLVVSFGGPEKHEDVLPFLQNVLRGRNVPEERMLEVAEHYYHFNGRSPINQQNLDLIAALRQEFQAHKMNLPVYWGNRNWHPLLPDTLKKMHADGVRRAVALATSAFGSYSGCRQYRENILQALQSASVDDIVIEKLPNFYDRPEFLEVMTERVKDALAKLPDAQQVIFTAHSIPVSMAQSSPYVRQLEIASEHVASECRMRHWALVYQSRSGPPSQPWLEPDISNYLRAQHGAGVQRVIVCPIGFMSDHMEVLYDLDTQVQKMCDEIGIKMMRAGTAGSHPKIISMIRDLVVNSETTPVNAYCEPGCCPAPQRPGR